MSYTKKIASSICLSILMFSISPLAMGSTTLKGLSPKNKHPKEEYLFVESADKATIKIIPGKDKTYTIVLKNIDPFVTYFSDRPIRDAGELSIEKFIEMWHHKNVNSFRENPPNAVLHAKKGGFFSDVQVFNFAIIVTEPYYDKKSGTLSFTAKPLPGNVDSLPESETFHHVSIFIDSVCLTCWGK